MRELFPQWPIEAKPPQFDGGTFDAKLDGQRLGKQLEAVRAVLADGQWRTLRQISQASGAPEASVSARLRDLRKPKFGGQKIESRRASMPGVWEYRMARD